MQGCVWSRAGEFGPAELRLRHPEDPCPTTRALEVQPTRAGTTGVLIDQRAQTSRGHAGQAVLKVHEGGHGEALARCAPAPGTPAAALRHRPHRRGLLRAGGGSGGGGRRRTAGWGLPPAAWRPGACASLSPRPWQCRQIRPPPRPKSNEASGGARIYSCVRPLTRSSRMRKMPAD